MPKTRKTPEQARAAERDLGALDRERDRITGREGTVRGGFQGRGVELGSAQHQALAALARREAAANMLLESRARDQERPPAPMGRNPAGASRAPARSRGAISPRGSGREAPRPALQRQLGRVRDEETRRASPGEPRYHARAVTAPGWEERMAAIEGLTDEELAAAGLQRRQPGSDVRVRFGEAQMDPPARPLMVDRGSIERGLRAQTPPPSHAMGSPEGRYSADYQRRQRAEAERERAARAAAAYDADSHGDYGRARRLRGTSLEQNLPPRYTEHRAPRVSQRALERLSELEEEQMMP